MKKILSVIISVFFILPALVYTALAENTAINSEKTIKATLPTFDVTVNGVKYDSMNSEYPFLVYNDITYMPMTADFAEFMGLTVMFDEGVRRHAGDMIFFVGAGARSSEVLGQYIKGTPNTSPYYEAVIPDYHIYIQKNDFDDEIDNINTPYPVFNYGGVTYLPLTFDIMYHSLDWEYTFNRIDGLVIDSTNAVRPMGTYRYIWQQFSPYTYGYYYDRNCYVEYGHNIWSNGTIEYATSLGTKNYHLSEQLGGKINYLGYRIDENEALVRLDSPASLTGNIFSITCARTDFGNATVYVKIDLSTGEVISCEEVPKAEEERE